MSMSLMMMKMLLDLGRDIIPHGGEGRCARRKCSLCGITFPKGGVGPLARRGQRARGTAVAQGEGGRGIEEARGTWRSGSEGSSCATLHPRYRSTWNTELLFEMWASNQRGDGGAFAIAH
jgi:hypothetical protein